jgi:hypothetical protein
MTKTDLLRFADLLDRQADDRRERAIIADNQRGGSVPDSEVDRWASSFATAYQTLRGIAAAVRELASEDAHTPQADKG